MRNYCFPFSNRYAVKNGSGSERRRGEFPLGWGSESHMRSNSFWVVTRRLIRWRLEAIHTKTHMYCIVLANCPHGTWQCSEWKCTFLKTGLRVEKNAALSFSCGRRIRILSETMTPSPHPSTSSLRPLNPATSHNNNGELLLVFMFLACSVSSSLFLVNFKCHLEACNMNYRVFCHFQWIRMDVNILETMLRKMEEKKIVLVRVDQ